MFSCRSGLRDLLTLYCLDHFILFLVCMNWTLHSMFIVSGFNIDLAYAHLQTFHQMFDNVSDEAMFYILLSQILPSVP